MSPNCTLPPEGWHCSRAPGHDGPCAARPSMTDAQNSGEAERIARIVADRCHGTRKPGTSPQRYATIWQAARLGALEVLSSTPAPSDQAGWQDIATAPFNELVWCFEPHNMGGFMFAGGKNNGGSWYNNLDDKRQYPTHWMPLPTAPTLTAGEGGVS